jgi:hypothetical protein
VLRKPTFKLVKAESVAFGKKYAISEQALRKLCSRFPRNTNASEVMLKALVLNKLYSTRVNDKDIEPLARHIAGLNIDTLLDKGSFDAVDLIADCPDLDREYSFATKFCALHNPAAYPIYDGNADECLWAYRKQDRFAKFFRKDLRDYPVWVNTVREFRAYYKLSHVSFRQLDKFLWSEGARILQGSR